jgi:ribosomal protein L34E
MANCKFCGKEIVWVKEGKRNRPVESDGTIHSCEEMKKSLGSIKSIKPSTLSKEEIEKYEQGINKKK